MENEGTYNLDQKLDTVQTPNKGLWNKGESKLIEDKYKNGFW